MADQRPGLMAISAFRTSLTPVLVIPEPARMPNLEADPKFKPGAPVLDVQTYICCNALPVVSFTAVVTVPVYVVNGNKLTAGLKEAVVPVYVTVPTMVSIPSRIMEAELIVEGFISVLKVTVMILSNGTPIARFAGSVDKTSGHTPTIST